MRSLGWNEVNSVWRETIQDQHLRTVGRWETLPPQEVAMHLRHGAPPLATAGFATTIARRELAASVFLGLVRFLLWRWLLLRRLGECERHGQLGT